MSRKPLTCPEHRVRMTDCPCLRPECPLLVCSKFWCLITYNWAIARWVVGGPAEERERQPQPLYDGVM